MRVAVVGSINADITINVAEFARRNETVIGQRDYILSQGGKGANQAAAAASAGIAVHMIARVGSDDLGTRAIESLKEAGVDCSWVTVTAGAATGLAAILVDSHGDNIISVAPGANGQLDATDVMAAESIIAQADALIVQLEVPLDAVEAAVRLAKAHGAVVILNPAPAPAGRLTFLSEVDILVPNQHEARHLAELYGAASATPEEAARLLIAAGARNVVVTLGAEGCLVATSDSIQHVPPYRVAAVDSTGAGDVFCGFLTCAVTRGRPLIDAVREASAAAALSVTRPQARSQLPTQAEVQAFTRAYA